MVNTRDIRKKIQKVKLFVLDFDGVMTDDKVYVDENGIEVVCCSRSDGLGIELVKKKGIKVIVVSGERSPAVRARCNKLKIPFFQGARSKLEILKRICKTNNISCSQVCYLGNDVSDIECVKFAGLGCAVRNSHHLLLKVSDYVTTRRGGDGAVREICDLIVAKS